jgi:hypothetical protein
MGRHDVDREVRIETQQGTEVVSIPFRRHDSGTACVSKVLGDRSQQFGEGDRCSGVYSSPGITMVVITTLLVP